MDQRWDVAVVGAGASGTLVARGLLRRARVPLTVMLLEAGDAFGRGVAYSTTEPRHVLNVPAERMGADEDDPAGFLRWARSRGVDAAPGDFLPRMLFGEYLVEVLRDAERGSVAELIRRQARVTRVARDPKGGFVLETSGGVVHARVVVLATGNLAPADPRVPDGGVYGSDRYIGTAWRPEALARIDLDEDVLLVGTGLTTVDALLTLAGRGHRGRIVALSPHGMFPRPHRRARAETGGASSTFGETVSRASSSRKRDHLRESSRERAHSSSSSREGDRGRSSSRWRELAYSPSREGDHARSSSREGDRGYAPSREKLAGTETEHLERARPASTVRALLRLVRAEADRGDWRAVVDALRPETIRLWRSLSDPERRRFLRHLRYFWEVHRHRMAPDVAAALDELRARGQLQIVRGRLASFARDGAEGVIVRYRPRGRSREEQLHVARVVNCTGPRPPFVATETLFASLLQAGLARPDPLRLGFDTGHGALIDTDGNVAPDLFAIGPLRRGELWETTAIPEIRTQADEVAARVLDAISGIDAQVPGATSD